MKLYGNLINRIEESKKHYPEITEGMDITMYHYSDRTCYYVTKVESQKKIQVKEYHVCAKKGQGGLGAQEWEYFKSRAELNKYLGLTDEFIKEDEPETWVYRYNHWNKAYTYTKDDLDEPSVYGIPMREILDEDDVKKLESGKSVTKYYRLDGSIRFGVRSYYFDWEF